MEINTDQIKTTLVIVSGIYTVLSLIIRVTPTKKDDEALEKIKGFVDKALYMAEIIFLSSKKKKNK
jgi:hypothetical protein